MGVQVQGWSPGQVQAMEQGRSRVQEEGAWQGWSQVQEEGAGLGAETDRYPGPGTSPPPPSHTTDSSWKETIGIC